MCDTCFKHKIKTIGFAGHRLRGDRSTFQRDHERKTERELGRYRRARKEGIQPDGTTRQKIERAERWSDHYQTPYRGNDRIGSLKKAGVVEDTTPIRQGSE